jgi:hypothetical protein
MLVEGVVAMTRIRIVGAGLAALMVLAVLVPAAASAGGQEMRFRYYRGTTSQGEPVTANTYLKDGTRRGRIFFRSVTLDCEDGTQTRVGLAWALRMPPDIDVDYVSPLGAFRLHGRLGVHRGSGTLSFADAQLDADEQAMLCSSGELTWQVERTDAGSASLPAADVQMRVASRADGTTRTVITSADGTTRTIITEADGTTRLVTSEEGTAAGRPRLRYYRGRTSQALQMFVVTAKVDTTLHLSGLSVDETLACEDGTEVKWFGGFLAGRNAALSPARLDVDYVSPFDAFHIHGRLGTHVGSGTASDAIPRLTADEQAMLCTTGDLTWRLWRTDAGARPIVP